VTDDKTTVGPAITGLFEADQKVRHRSNLSAHAESTEYTATILRDGLN
jgi:hypothetical protein